MRGFHLEMRCKQSTAKHSKATKATYINWERRTGRGGRGTASGPARAQGAVLPGSCVQETDTGLL
jgi:hypothetical protein